MADALFGLGLMSSNKVVVKSGADFVTVRGQATMGFRDALDEARGGILFIDRAPLVVYDFVWMKQAMESDKFQDVLVVVGGYPSEIDEMMTKNEFIHLKSTFTHWFDFPSLEDDCVGVFERHAKNEEFVMGDRVREEIEKTVLAARNEYCWGNGHDVKNFWDDVKFARAERLYECSEIDRMIQVDDILVAAARVLGNVDDKGFLYCSAITSKSRCPCGFEWSFEGTEWRCSGGFHSVSKIGELALPYY
jgi:hypothetical protein